MARSRKVYVDTSAFIAFCDRSDSYHPLFARLFSDPPQLLTTPLVVAEGQAWFLRRYDPTKALHFLSMIEVMTPLEVVSVGAEEQAAAIEVLRRFSDQTLTLTDASGLSLMQSRQIESCWSTDFHLGLLGAKLVIH